MQPIFRFSVVKLPDHPSNLPHPCNRNSQKQKQFIMIQYIILTRVIELIRTSVCR